MNDYRGRPDSIKPPRDVESRVEGIHACMVLYAMVVWLEYVEEFLCWAREMKSRDLYKIYKTRVNFSNKKV